MKQKQKQKTKKNKKRKRVRQRKVGSQNSAPTLKLSLRLCQLNQIELTQWTKKKLSLSKFSNILNPKFLIQKFFPNFQIHILNAQMLNSTLQFSIKTQTSNFMIKIPTLDFKNSKGSKFQILNSRFKKEFFSKVSKVEIKISKLQNFKNQMFLKRNFFLSIKLFLIKFKSRKGSHLKKQWECKALIS